MPQALQIVDMLTSKAAQVVACARVLRRGTPKGTPRGTPAQVFACARVLRRGTQEGTPKGTPRGTPAQVFMCARVLGGVLRRVLAQAVGGCSEAFSEGYAHGY